MTGNASFSMVEAFKSAGDCFVAGTERAGKLASRGPD